MRNLHQLFVLFTASQIIGGDFAKFCGLLRMCELYPEFTTVVYSHIILKELFIFQTVHRYSQKNPEMIYCMTSIFLRRNFSSESLLSEKELYSTAYKNFSQHGASQPTMAKSILPPVQSNFLPAHKYAFSYNLVC